MQDYNKYQVIIGINGHNENSDIFKSAVSITKDIFSNSEDIIGSELDIEIDEKGFIKVDDFWQTSEETIWAVGDVVRGPMLAHKGSEEGIIVAERIAGKKAQME